jgi:hypothetical protein
MKFRAGVRKTGKRDQAGSFRLDLRTTFGSVADYEKSEAYVLHERDAQKRIWLIVVLLLT